MTRLNSILADLLDRDASDFNLSSSKDDFDTWDSIAVINLAVSLEEEYGITLAAEDVERLTSVRQITEVLKEKGVDSEA